MSDDEHTTDRRSVLQLSLGTALSALVPVGATAAQSDGEVHVDESLSDGSGTKEVLISLNTAALEEASIDGQADVEETREQVLQSQEPVKTTLEQTLGVDVHRQFWIGNTIFARVDTEQVDIQADIATLDSVHAVYENEEVEPPETEREPMRLDAGPQDSDGPTPTYGLQQINSLAATDAFGTNGEGTKVAVLDTGIDADHPAHADFDTENYAEFTLMGEEVATDPVDRDGHGTHVSGTVAGEPAEDSEGTERAIGVAPDVELLNAKVLRPWDGERASGTSVMIVAGMQWAVENGADVINMSLGGSTADGSSYSGIYLEAARDVLGAGTLPVASSGNAGQGLTASPGNVLESFAVGGTNENFEAYSSSSGEQVYSEDAWGNDKPDDYPTWYTVPDVSAPGVDVLSSVPGDNTYQEFTGTSMASPHVAGAAAKLLSDDAVSDPIEASSILEETAVHPSGAGTEGTKFGVGAVDVLGALAHANGGGTVTGTVTDASEDSPLAEFEVGSNFGTRAFTNADGEYELHLPSGESEVQLDRFGYTATSETVDVPADGTAEQDVALEPELDLALLSLQQPPTGFAQPPEITRGESFTISLFVANLDELTVELADATEGIEQGDVTFAIGDTEFGPGDTLPVGGLTGPVNLVVNIAAGSPAAPYTNDQNIVDGAGLQQAIEDLQNNEIDGSVFNAVLEAFVSGDPVEGGTGGEGTLALEHTFAGLGDETTVPTGPTAVKDGQPATFEITDPVLPDETGGEKDADDDSGTVNISATIENTGDVRATKSVTYTIAGFPFSDTLTIDAGETADYGTEIRNLVAAGFGGLTVDHSLSTPSDSVSGQLFITQPDSGSETGEITVDGINAPESVTVGDTVEVTATVGSSRSKDPYATLVRYQFNEAASQSDTPAEPSFKVLEVPSEGQAVTTFSMETDGLLPGEYEHSIITANDSQTATITVQETAASTGEPAAGDD